MTVVTPSKGLASHVHSAMLELSGVFSFLKILASVPSL